MNTKSLVKAALIAALYAALTIILAPISYGAIQCRVSEALTLLPFYMPEAVPGLLIGCVIANLYSEMGLLDIIFGSLATLIAAVLTRKSRNIYIAAFWPVLSNMIIISLLISYLTDAPLIITGIYVALGEAAACYIIGVPLMKLLENRNIISKS
ncbi:MAG: QueT transporter family protein [Synergistaceae bacterium]|nr:QueT transporter family protein [Synergistaceae bacterium]